MASFWRGLGYFISIIMIIVGFVLFPIGLIGVTLGFIFIWMLRRSAQQEKIVNHLRNLDERDKADRKKAEKHEKELKHEEELREEQRIKDEIKRLEDKKKQLEKEKGD